MPWPTWSWGPWSVSPGAPPWTSSRTLRVGGARLPGGLSGGCRPPVHLVGSLWPEPVADRHAHGTVSHSLSSSVGPELLLRALLVGEGRSTRTLGAPGAARPTCRRSARAGGSSGRSWALGLGSSSILCLQDQSRVGERAPLGCSCSRTVPPPPSSPLQMRKQHEAAKALERQDRERGR